MIANVPKEEELTGDQKMQNLISLMSMKAQTGNKNAQFVMDHAQDILAEGLDAQSDKVKFNVMKAIEDIGKQGAEIAVQKGEK